MITMASKVLDQVFAKLDVLIQTVGVAVKNRICCLPSKSFHAKIRSVFINDVNFLS